MLIHISVMTVVENHSGAGGIKLNTFLHINEHTERICQYLVRQVDAEPSKIGHFQFSK